MFAMQPEEVERHRERMDGRSFTKGLLAHASRNPDTSYWFAIIIVIV